MRRDSSISLQRCSPHRSSSKAASGPDSESDDDLIDYATRKRLHSDHGGKELARFDTDAMQRDLANPIDTEALRIALNLANLKYSKPSGWQPVQLSTKSTKRVNPDAESEDDWTDEDAEGEDDEDHCTSVYRYLNSTENLDSMS